jgi:mRNA-degrading endonuclease RelE of RelBE toxin-antitoxin system
MTWIITHKPAYDTDFIELPKNLQKQATQAHAELVSDPLTPRGDTIKKLKGWDNVWRYRLGDYRLIYSALRFPSFREHRVKPQVLNALLVKVGKVNCFRALTTKMDASCPGGRPESSNQGIDLVIKACLEFVSPA